MASGSEPTPPPSGSGARLPRSLGANRVVVAVDRTRGRGGEGSGGAKPRRAPARSAVRAREAQVSRESAVGRVTGLPGGARLRSGRNGRVPASPKVTCRPSGRRVGRLARWKGGLDDRGKSRTPFPRRAPRLSARGGKGRGSERNAAETGRTAGGSSRRIRHGRRRTRKEAEGRRKAARLLGRGKL
jgi:hypothetical protein